ncbi:Nitrogen permease regulator 2 [Nowakowskiella sp. JEL0078]|nr:Nitrogen permease regulator 2 [Nowakowskiella sp. JEL0078]
MEAQFPPLVALFFAEFDPQLGPKISYEIPEGFVSSFVSQSSIDIDSTNTVCLDFDSISEFIIPKVKLCNRLLAISADSYKILGFAVSIENLKYPRNELKFNLCFVFDQSADTVAYEQIVKKMARVLRSLEEESEFIFNPSTKASIFNIMEQLFESLNSHGECEIPINGENMINVKLFPKFPDPPLVYAYQVPIFTTKIKEETYKLWDMTLCRIIPMIDGVHSVKRISDLSDVEVGLVRLAVRHLL